MEAFGAEKHPLELLDAGVVFDKGIRYLFGHSCASPSCGE
jgi:hypothetical protein